MYLWETCEEEDGCGINSSWRRSADLWTTEVAVLALANFRPPQEPALQHNSCLASQKAKELDPKPANRKDLQCVSIQFSLLKGILLFFPA